MRIDFDSIRFRYPARGSGRKAARAAAKNPQRDWVIDDVSFAVEEGEFFTLLGPSGCGKTTLLWIVAGFLRADEGRLLLGGDDVGARPPERRNVGIVFQNYALFPHMTVAENVAFGLKGRGLSADESRGRVQEMLELVALGTLGERRPGELSGGQQQRVAMARALAPRPGVLLMDEPLSNLDAALRVETRERFRELQRRLGITTLYVTHDQEEAMAVSDRVAVMRGGRVRQIGTPEEVYDRPCHVETAAFLGRCNLLRAQPIGDGTWRVAGLGEMSLPPTAVVANDNQAHTFLAIRPERVSLDGIGGETTGERIAFVATFEFSEFLGERRLLRFRLADEGVPLFDVVVPSSQALPPDLISGAKTKLSFATADARLIPNEDAEG